MIEQMTTCPWLAYASIIRRRRLSGESPALRFGGLLHRVLAYRYRMQWHDKPFDERAQIRALQHLFTSTPCELEGWRNCDNAIKAIRGYNSNYAKEDFHVATNPFTSFPYVEQPFAVDTHKTIRGRKIIYVGRIDLKVVFPDKSTYTLDHKTTSMLGDTFWQDQQMTGQHRGYIWADRECTGTECTGYIVNAIGAKESISRAEYDDVLGRVVPTGKSQALPLELSRQRFFTRVPPGQIDEWFENMLAQVDRFLYNVDCGFFPRHYKHCIHKYGVCTFYNVCSLPQESREHALMSSAYQENEWTPLYN